MAKYLLAYRGGHMPETPEGQAQAMAKGCPVLAGGASIEVCELLEVM
jgi:hypothetical protein